MNTLLSNLNLDEANSRNTKLAVLLKTSLPLLITIVFFMWYCNFSKLPQILYVRIFGKICDTGKAQAILFSHKQNNKEMGKG